MPVGTRVVACAIRSAPRVRKARTLETVQEGAALAVGSAHGALGCVFPMRLLGLPILAAVAEFTLGG